MPTQLEVGPTPKRRLGPAYRGMNMRNRTTCVLAASVAVLAAATPGLAAEADDGVRASKTF